MFPGQNYPTLLGFLGTKIEKLEEKFENDPQTLLSDRTAAVKAHEIADTASARRAHCHLFSEVTIGAS